MPGKILPASAGLLKLLPVGLAGERMPGLWSRLLVHWRDLCSRLDRDPGLRVALLDLVAVEDPVPALRGAAFQDEKEFGRWTEALMRDRATGLLSESFFRRTLHREEARVRRHREPAALLYLEPEPDFDSTAAEAGAAIGHEPLLAGIGARLAAVARESDLPARFGNSSAVLLMTGTDRGGAESMLGRLAPAPVREGPAAMRVRWTIEAVSPRGDGNTFFRARAGTVRLRLAAINPASAGGEAAARLASMPWRPAEGREVWEDRLEEVLAGSVRDPASAWAELSRILAPAPGRNAAALFRLLAGIGLDPGEASRHWNGIVRHAEALGSQLGRPVDPRTATLDFFLNRIGLLRCPVILPPAVWRHRNRSMGVDPLCRCDSSAGLEVALRREVRRARRCGTRFCLVRIEPDHFHDWTRRHGVESGNRFLRSIAARLIRQLRRSDVVARPGGGDFFLLLPRADRDGGMKAAERVRAALHSDIPGQPTGVTWRAGVVEFRTDSGHPLSLLQAATAAAERARLAGGDRVETGAPSHRRRFGV